MPSPSWSDGLVRPAPDAVNARIRRLMEQPASEQRAEEYSRLLSLWVDVTRPDWVKAA